MSLRRKLLFLQAAVVLIMVFFYHLGIEDRFFWSIWWYDIPMHMLGGAWAALFFAWVAAWRGTRLSLSQYVLAALAVGIAWELFEYVLGIGGNPYMSYSVDTAKDIVDDIIGGALSYALARLFV